MLVNNAGVVSRTPIADVTDREWARVLAINLTGPMIGTRAVLPLMRDSGGGSIVNIASTAALVGHPGSKSWGSRLAFCLHSDARVGGGFNRIDQFLSPSGMDYVEEFPGKIA